MCIHLWYVLYDNKMLIVRGEIEGLSQFILNMRGLSLFLNAFNYIDYICITLNPYLLSLSI